MKNSKLAMANSRFFDFSFWSPRCDDDTYCSTMAIGNYFAIVDKAYYKTKIRPKGWPSFGKECAPIPNLQRFTQNKQSFIQIQL